MARELILRLKPPAAKGADYLLQQLGAAVSALGDGGKHVMGNVTTRVNCVGPRDAILTLIPHDSVSEDQLQAVAQIAETFSGPFRVEAEFGDAAASAPAPSPAPASAPDSGEDASAYADWSKADLQAECEERGLAKSGNKDALVARLEEDDSADPEDDESGDE